MTAPQSLKRLAETFNSVTTQLGTRAEALTERVEGLSKSGNIALDAHEATVEQMEGYVAEIEDAVNQMSNQPPLGVTQKKPNTPPPGVTLNPDYKPDPNKKADDNGVIVNK
jgi:hypothetical protein